jgi:hypothetical protein
MTKERTGKERQRKEKEKMVERGWESNGQIWEKDNRESH